MTPEQITLVQTTWKQVAPNAEQVAQLFYGRLFDSAPEVRRMFPADMAEQRTKLMQMLGVAVAGLTRLDEIVPAVEALGVRHIDYGAVGEHYDAVGAALLWTLRQGLGEGFTPEVEEAWAETYQTLAAVMQQAATTAAPTAV
ncbi:MAG: globin family protein [Planctomycetota bacterium]